MLPEPFAFQLSSAITSLPTCRARSSTPDRKSSPINPSQKIGELRAAFARAFDRGPVPAPIKRGAYGPLDLVGKRLADAGWIDGVGVAGDEQRRRRNPSRIDSGCLGQR